MKANEAVINIMIGLAERDPMIRLPEQEFRSIGFFMRGVELMARHPEYAMAILQDLSALREKDGYKYGPHDGLLDELVRENAIEVPA